MKIPLLAFLLGTSTLPAGTLMLSDNFNAPDTANFDQPDHTGRRTGLLGPSVQLRSSRIQLEIQAIIRLIRLQPNFNGANPVLRHRLFPKKKNDTLTANFPLVWKHLIASLLF